MSGAQLSLSLSVSMALAKHPALSWQQFFTYFLKSKQKMAAHQRAASLNFLEIKFYFGLFLNFVLKIWSWKHSLEFIGLDSVCWKVEVDVVQLVAELLALVSSKIVPCPAAASHISHASLSGVVCCVEPISNHWELFLLRRCRQIGRQSTHV